MVRRKQFDTGPANLIPSSSFVVFLIFFSFLIYFLPFSFSLLHFVVVGSVR